MHVTVSRTPVPQSSSEPHQRHCWVAPAHPSGSSGPASAAWESAGHHTTSPCQVIPRPLLRGKVGPYAYTACRSGTGPQAQQARDMKRDKWCCTAALHCRSWHSLLALTEPASAHEANMKPTRKHARLFDKIADTLHQMIHTKNSIIMVAHVWAEQRVTALKGTMHHLMHTMNIRIMIATFGHEQRVAALKAYSSRPSELQCSPRA